MARRYQRKTDYVPYAERHFSIRAVLRDPPDLDKLVAAYLRSALVRYEQAQAEREHREPRDVSPPTIEGPRERRSRTSAADQPAGDLPAVAYLRVATTNTQDAGLAVEAQRAMIATAARRLGLRLADEFTDVGYSGRSMDRPGRRRLLDHVATHQVGYCVVASLDRFSRRPEDAADIDEALSDARVAIVDASRYSGGQPPMIE